MKFLFFSMMVTILLGAPFGVGHEGHDHGHKHQIRAPKGGLIQELKGNQKVDFVEVVAKGKGALEIYLYDHDLKAVKGRDSGPKISATVKLPRKKKVHPLELKSKGKGWVTHFDAKKAHRYLLKVNVDRSAAQFNIEPR